MTIEIKHEQRLLPYVSPDSQAVNLDFESTLLQESGSDFDTSGGGVNNDDEW